MTDPYEAVLADLRAKRSQIDQTIALLTALRGEPIASVPEHESAEPSGSVDAGAYLGMSIPEATKHLLATKKRAMANAEIYKELVAGGLVLTGADPVNVVSSVLTRRFNQIGDIVRVARGTWGLKDWYPNRSFKNPSSTISVKVDKLNPTLLQINDLGGVAQAGEDDDI